MVELELSGDAPAPGPKPRTTTLSLTIKDRNVLYTAYISFFKNGGLFIPTSRTYHLNEEITMVLNLISETEPFTVKGTVRWLTPQGAHGNRAPGIGVQFDEATGTNARNKIENYLAGMLKSENPTHTL